jgi:hypothetical protein
MPNWCEGTLKVRGKTKDLKRFILEGLQPVTFLGDRCEPLKPDENYGWNVSAKGTLYIENTYRGFVENLDVYLDNDDEDTDIICLDSKFAWGISPTELQKTCIKYHVDMKIYAFECGMEFNRDIEIVDGEIVKDEEITFKGKDYTWECICPKMGG